MNFRFQKIATAIALFLTFAVVQVYVGASFAAPRSNSRVGGRTPQTFGILKTRDNKPITVNGASALDGATIPSGSTVETPAGVGATINFGPLGTLCISPNTKLSLEFDRQGNGGSIRVALQQGCVILRTLKNVSGAITTAQGNAGIIDAATGGSMDVCLSPGATAPTVNQGAAVDAGAGASALDCGGAAGAAAIPPGPVISARTAFIIAGGSTLFGVIFTFHGENPSPTGP